MLIVKNLDESAVLEKLGSLAIACRFKVRPDFHFEAFDGKFSISPEMLTDLEDYYNITPSELFNMILTLEKNGQISNNGELDVHVRHVKTLRSKEYQIWELEIVQGPISLFKTYFSSNPININYFVEDNNQKTH